MDIDVIVVGAGPAGLYLATELSRAGRQVRVLEAGPLWRTSDFVSSQIWARRLKWRGAPVSNTGVHRFGHNMATGSGVGGAAIHHYAGWPRLREADFESHSRYGRGLDWPIGYESLRPWYDRIQAEFGISGDAAAEQGRPAGDPYPMPPLPTFAQAQIVSRGFESLGLTVSPAPMAINSVPYGGRPACIYDGWCDAGCPTGALANPLVTQLDPAREAGVQIESGAEVVHIDTDPDGLASGVQYVDANGRRRTLAARLVILAASTIQNARLMLHSRSARHPRGLGNGNDLVGRYFMGHSMLNVHGLFDKPTQNHFGVTGAPQLCLDGYGKDRGEGKPFGSFIWGFGAALKPNDLLGVALTRPQLFGPALDDFLRRGTRHLAMITAICETLPEYDNRIMLGERRDAHGVPLAEIGHTLSENSLALWEYALEEGERIVAAAGARERWASGLFMSHPLGGTVMGRDAAASVCDSYGCAHDCPNLFLAGGGLFPAAGAGGPTFTIYALAARSAAHINAHWRELAA